MHSIPECPYKLQALTELQHYHQWVCYIFVTRGKKISKPPMNPHEPEFPPRRERLADATNPQTWASYETAVTAWVKSETYKGIGFVFTAEDPFCGVDLDHCIDPATGTIAPWALRILKLLNSYSEVSATGTGIHIYIKASLSNTFATPNLKHKKGNIEIYDEERYFTWSNRHIKGTSESVEERQDQLNELYFELFFIEEEDQTPTLGERITVLSEAELPDDDNALIALAENARGSNGHLFSELWRGHVTRYTKADSNEIDYSRADLALCSILAYWTQRDAARTERLFRQSALYRPERWNQPARHGETYGQGTIRVALARCHKVYDPAWRPDGWKDRDEFIAQLRKQSLPQNAIQEGGARS